jgi:hypothetical protein
VNNPLLRFPSGYTIIVAKKRPMVIPTAICIMLAATLKINVSVSLEEELVVVDVVLFVSSFAVLRPLTKLPVAARPLGTWTKIAGSTANMWS